ncbi:hypothetical protein B0H15DRAFT_799714 [Mycena belliarum]|uniref:C2H2-type domain-containing protein n=1 Tax=Mycena belliarum TaxID=1033014 RepID=A0AAD6XW23_9AGAR|nr:hypothetical protein B0H15DRAFT_799714 [Mycena belliae]
MQRNNMYPYSSNSDSPPPSSGGYAQPSQPYDQRGQYTPTSNVRAGHQHQGPYYPPIAPAPPPPSSSQYRGDYANPPPSAYPSQYVAGDNRGYQYPYNASAPRPATSSSYHHAPRPRNFIPTPSETYANPRPPRPASAMQVHSSRSNASYPPGPHAALPPLRTPHQSSSHSALPSASTSTERFICEVCGKDFSRAHDRKRHHETQHAAAPTTHKCPWCQKDFSRADSLRRHIQNGCDEAPPQ